MKRSPMRRKAKEPGRATCESDVPKATGRRIDGGKSPWRSEAYRKYVRETFPCLTCQRQTDHAHHIRECFPNRSMGVKISDKYVVPLCEGCHRELHARSSTFWMQRHVWPVLWCEAAHAAWSAA